MKRTTRPRILPLAVLLVVVISAVVWAEYDMVDIRVLLEETGAELEWDEFGRTGIIWKGLDSIAFAPDHPVAVADFDELLRIEPIVYQAGTLLLPEPTRQLLAERLGLSGDAVRVRPIKAIVIDAGHGGKDPGTNVEVSEDGNAVLVMEKNLVLDIARRVKDVLSDMAPDSQVVLSRNGDVFLELEERTAFAHGLRADPMDNILFVSIHVNATATRGWSDARGVEIYYLPPTHRRQVLEREIADTLDPEVATILNDIKEEEYTVESVLMGQYVLDAISQRMPETPIVRGIRVADFFVVREARMPSILIETGFINNREDLALLRTPEYRQRMAESIAAGISAYVSEFERLQ